MNQQDACVIDGQAELLHHLREMQDKKSWGKVTLEVAIEDGIPIYVRTDASKTFRRPARPKGH